MSAIDTAGGFVAVYRSLLDHPLMNQLPAIWFRIFIAILLKTNWKPGKFFDGAKHVTIAPGSMVTSLAKLGQMTLCSVKEVRGCLQYLQKAQIAEVRGTHRYSIITILNWSAYQPSGNTEGKPRREDKGKQRARSGQTKGKPRATIEQRNKKTRKSNCFSGADFIGYGDEGLGHTDKRFSADEPQQQRLNGGDAAGVSEPEPQSQNQNQNQNLSVRKRQSQKQPPSEVSSDTSADAEQASPIPWTPPELAEVRARVCRLLPIEPDAGFEMSVWYRVNHAPASEVCAELDRLYAKPAYRHPRGRYRLHHQNGILEVLGNIFVGYHPQEPAARPHADHVATAEQMAAGIGAIELVDASAAPRGSRGLG